MGMEIWSDLHQDLVVDGQGSLKKVINFDSVKTSIDNIIRTSPGERLFLPEFALGLGDALFEPVNDRVLSKMADSVKNSIEAWDDRVAIDDISFKSDPDMNSIYVSVVFRVKGFFESVSHTVVINQ